MRAEASSARQEAGKPAQEAEGRDPSWRGGGELAPHQLASCETGRITGKELGQTEMSGPQEQADSGGGDVGHGCWGPGDAGWSLGPPVPKTRHRPAASLGRGEAAGDAGAPGSPHTPPPPPEGAWASAGDGPAQPSRWLGRRPVGPSPAPQPDTGEARAASSLFPEEAASQRQASQPGILPRAARKAGGGLTP